MLVGAALLAACSAGDPPHAWLQSHQPAVHGFTNAALQLSNDLATLTHDVGTQGATTNQVVSFERDCALLSSEIRVAQGWQIPKTSSGSSAPQADLHALVADGVALVGDCQPLETASTPTAALSALDDLDTAKATFGSAFSTWAKSLS